MNIHHSDILQEIKKSNPFCIQTESSLLKKILANVSEEEKTIETCEQLFGMKSKGLDQDHLKRVKRKLNELKSEISKSEKEEFKRKVKETCGIDVFHESVSMHIPIPPEEEIQTALHQDAGRMLTYLKNMKELEAISLPEMVSVEEKKERRRIRREMNKMKAQIVEELNEVNSDIDHIIKALRSSFDLNSKVTYAKMVVKNFESIKAKLSALVEKRHELKKKLKKYIKEGQRTLRTVSDYIDDQCDICMKKEKNWDDSWKMSQHYEPMTAEDARNFHSRFVRCGGMRGLVDQLKSLLNCEITDPQLALPTLVCSMTDPKRADKLYQLISENYFLKDFRSSIVKKTEATKLPKICKQECMVCGITVKRASF